MPGILLDLCPGREDVVLANPHRCLNATPSVKARAARLGAGKARFQENLLPLTPYKTYLKPKQVGKYQCTKANG